MNLTGKNVLVTGGTGSLGKTLVSRLLSGEVGTPSKVTVFSRDEAKQHYMRLDFLKRATATDEVIYRRAEDVLSFRIGDVRDGAAVRSAVAEADVIFHAAALKQVPSCEYHPFEAVQTNILGAQNIVNAVREAPSKPSHVIGISTDKACKPVNVMGLTKALQERILIEANLECRGTVFNCVRYGNVIASRGSIVPLFLEQISAGREVTITLPEMTRFLLTLERAVDTVIAAVSSPGRGETFVPKVPAAKITDVAKAMMGGKDIPIVFTGIRPGEKVHEIMVSEEECFRTVERGDYYVILPVLPELRGEAVSTPVLQSEYSSRDVNIGLAELQKLLNQAMGEINQFAGEGA